MDYEFAVRKKAVLDMSRAQSVFLSLELDYGLLAWTLNNIQGHVLKIEICIPKRVCRDHIHAKSINSWSLNSPFLGGF